MSTRRYFTFIEMMIVLMIIGIIAASVSYNLGGGVKEAKRFETSQAVRSLQSAVYYQITSASGSQVIAALQQKNWPALMEKLTLLNKEQKTLYSALLASGELECSYDPATQEVTVTKRG